MACRRGRGVRRRPRSRGTFPARHGQRGEDSRDGDRGESIQGQNPWLQGTASCGPPSALLPGMPCENCARVNAVSEACAVSVGGDQCRRGAAPSPAGRRVAGLPAAASVIVVSVGTMVNASREASRSRTAALHRAGVPRAIYRGRTLAPSGWRRRPCLTAALPAGRHRLAAGGKGAVPNAPGRPPRCLFRMRKV